MKKIMLAAILTLGMLSPASADYRRGGGGYHGGWVAPLVGGMIVGGIVGGALAQPRYPGPVYIEEPRRYHTECRFEQRWDRYGNYMGDVEICRKVVDRW